MASNAENVSTWWRLLMAMCYPQSEIEPITVLCSLAVRGRWYTDIYICATLKFWQLHDLNNHILRAVGISTVDVNWCASQIWPSRQFMSAWLIWMASTQIIYWYGEMGVIKILLVIPLSVFTKYMWIEICCTCDLIARITLLCKCHLQQWNFPLLYCYVWHWHSRNHRIEPQPLF